MRSPALGWDFSVYRTIVSDRTEDGARVDLQNFIPVFPACVCFPLFTREWTKGLLLEIYNHAFCISWFMGISFKTQYITVFILNICVTLRFRNRADSHYLLILHWSFWSSSWIYIGIAKPSVNSLAYKMPSHGDSKDFRNLSQKEDQINILIFFLPYDLSKFN